MKSSRVRVLVTLVAVTVLVAGVVFVSGASGGRTPGRPVRALGPGGNADAQIALSGPGAPAVPELGKPAKPTRTPPLRTLKSVPSSSVPWVKRELKLEAEEAFEEGEARPLQATELGQTDGALQTRRGAATMPPPDLHFAGQKSTDNPFKLVPPDTNGDVGSGFYVQMVNSTLISVYSTLDGSRLMGPTTMSTLFSSMPTKLCAKHDDGDPVVVYDPLADQWLISQFALNFNTNKYAECIAVSETSDPTGVWVAYQFDYPKPVLNDYPKFGVWPDAYYASFNQFKLTNQGFRWAGGGAVAYERDQMLLGNTADQIYVNLFNVREDLGGMLPSDLDGTTAPPVGAANVFAMFDADEWGYPKDQIELWGFDVDFATPGDSTFQIIKKRATQQFNPWICGVNKLECIPQKGTPNLLDSLSDRLMFRFAYRNMGGGDEAWAVTHSVRAGAGRSGVRWYEIHRTGGEGGAWTIPNQGTFAPGANRSRWMGSAAMDKDGNLAVGYSISSAGTFPSIGYAGRLAGDLPANELTQGEVVAFNGLGSEKGTYARWGDYSDLVVDPADDCTFWYTTQYYSPTGQWSWKTRIMSFKFPGCV